MKYIITLMIVTLLSLQLYAGGDYERGELIVQLSGRSLGNSGAQAIPNLEKQYTGIGLRVKTNLSQRLDIWLFEYDYAKISDDKIISFLEADKSIKVAQFNHFIEMRETIPNDEHFPLQWPLHNTGQSGIEDADIDAAEAWDITVGDTTCQGDEIIIGILDSGFDLNHDDINFWKNTAEIPDDGIDNDNNGYVDDYDGWNVYANNGHPTISSHGTHVSGIAGAIGNNGIGISGVCQNVKIMPVSGSSTTESVVIAGYAYFYEMRSRYNETNGVDGAFVVVTNASFGRDGADPDDYPLWCAMYDSLGQIGVLNVGATANRGWDIDVTGDMPTACSSDYLIAVTNTTSSDVKTSGAGYGLTCIDLGSPGTSVYSTIPYSSYGTKSGTSMSAPHVSGTIALMFAAAPDTLITYYKNNLPEGSLIMRRLLLDNVDVLASLQGLCVTGGRLNANNAVLATGTWGTSTITIEGHQGWNQLSFPVNSDRTFTELFPDSTVVLSYDTPSGEYVAADVIDPSRAYWIRLPDSFAADISGETIEAYTFTANQGWNFLSSPLSVQSLDLSAYPQVEAVFEYNNGFIFNESKILEPGKAYWIKAGAYFEIQVQSE